MSVSLSVRAYAYGYTTFESTTLLVSHRSASLPLTWMVSFRCRYDVNRGSVELLKATRITQGTLTAEVRVLC
jgi:hypothetical protein